MMWIMTNQCSEFCFSLWSGLFSGGQSYIATLYVFVAMWNMWHLLCQGVDEDIEDEPVLRSGDLSFVIFYVEGGK